MCGEKYFGLQDPGEGIPQCTYHPVNNPSCPWFTIHDLVLYAGFISYANVASTVSFFQNLVNFSIPDLNSREFFLRDKFLG